MDTLFELPPEDKPETNGNVCGKCKYSIPGRSGIGVRPWRCKLDTAAHSAYDHCAKFESKKEIGK